MKIELTGRRGVLKRQGQVKDFALVGWLVETDDNIHCLFLTDSGFRYRIDPIEELRARTLTILSDIPEEEE